MSTAPGPPEAADEGDPDRGAARTGAAPAQPRDDDRPELLVKLQERKERHARRSLPARVGVVALGVLLVVAGVVLSGPGVPGPGFVVILIGLSFLALEFDRAERLLEKAIIAADRAKGRAENASPRKKALSAALSVLAIGGFVAAAILWDIPLLPV